MDLIIFLLIKNRISQAMAKNFRGFVSFYYKNKPLLYLVFAVGVVLRYQLFRLSLFEKYVALTYLFDVNDYFDIFSMSVFTNLMR